MTKTETKQFQYEIQAYQEDCVNNLMILHYADKMGSNRNLENFYKIQDYIADFQTTCLPKPLIDGNDLMQYGFQGKEIGAIKRMLFEKQLNDKFTTKEAGLKLVAELKK